jgi:hypothetical protein
MISTPPSHPRTPADADSDVIHVPNLGRVALPVGIFLICALLLNVLETPYFQYLAAGAVIAAELGFWSLRRTGASKPMKADARARNVSKIERKAGFEKRYSAFQMDGSANQSGQQK